MLVRSTSTLGSGWKLPPVDSFPCIPLGDPGSAPSVTGMDRTCGDAGGSGLAAPRLLVGLERKTLPSVDTPSLVVTPPPLLPRGLGANPGGGSASRAGSRDSRGTTGPSAASRPVSGSLSRQVVASPGEASTVPPGWLPPASTAAAPVTPLLLYEAGSGERPPLGLAGSGPGLLAPDPQSPCLHPYLFPAQAVGMTDLPPHTCG